LLKFLPELVERGDGSGKETGDQCCGDKGGLYGRPGGKTGGKKAPEGAGWW